MAVPRLLLLSLFFLSVSARSAPSQLSVCRTTPYPQLCSQILSSSPPRSSQSLSDQISAVTGYALRLTNSAYGAVLRERRPKTSSSSASTHPDSKKDSLAKGALEDCMDLMGNSIDELRQTMTKVSGLTGKGRPRNAARAQLMDAQVSLSASYTFQDTCQDELESHHDASSPASALLLRQGPAITRSIAVALSLADTLQHRL